MAEITRRAPIVIEPIKYDFPFTYDRGGKGYLTEPAVRYLQRIFSALSWDGGVIEKADAAEVSAPLYFSNAAQEEPNPPDALTSRVVALQALLDGVAMPGPVIPSDARATPGKNIFRRNGGMEVWQRGTSIAVAASTTAYTADGAYIITQANQASVVARATGLTDTSQYAAKVQRNNGQTGTSSVRWCIPLDTDELIQCRNRVCTLSFVAKAGANWSPTSGAITARVVFGTGAVAKRGAGSYTSETIPLTTSPAITTTTNTFIATGYVAASVTQAEIQFIWDPVGTAGADDSITIDDIKLEVGPYATEFLRDDFLDSLQLCQRHYQKTFAYDVTPADNPTNNFNGSIMSWGPPASGTYEPSAMWRFGQEMRTSPSVTLYNPSTGTAAQWNDTSTVGANARTIGVSAASVLFDNTGVNLANVGKYRIHAAADASI